MLYEVITISHPGCRFALQNVLRLYPLNLIRIIPAKGRITSYNVCYTKLLRVPFPRLESAEIIPVEPDPDHAGARERARQQTLRKPIRGVFCWEDGMQLTVNGEAHEHPGSGTLDALLDELGANKAHAAAMVNGDVVPSTEWAAINLREGDVVELLVFVGGG